MKTAANQRQLEEFGLIQLKILPPLRRCFSEDGVGDLTSDPCRSSWQTAAALKQTNTSHAVSTRLRQHDWSLIRVGTHWKDGGLESPMPPVLSMGGGAKLEGVATEGVSDPLKSGGQASEDTTCREEDRILETPGQSRCLIRSK